MVEFTYFKAKKFVDRVDVGVRIFIRKLREGYQEIAEVWQQDKHGQFYRMTAIKQGPESEVPPQIRAKAEGKMGNEKVHMTYSSK